MRSNKVNLILIRLCCFFREWIWKPPHRSMMRTIQCLWTISCLNLVEMDGNWCWDIQSRKSPSWRRGTGSPAMWGWMETLSTYTMQKLILNLFMWVFFQHFHHHTNYKIFNSYSIYYGTRAKIDIRFDETMQNFPSSMIFFIIESSLFSR